MRISLFVLNRVAAALALIGLLLGPVSSARADETNSSVSSLRAPIDILGDLGIDANNVGVVLDSSFTNPLSHVSRQSGSVISLCADLTESACPRTASSNLSYVFLGAHLILGKCERDTDIGCIENIKVSLAGGELKDLIYVESVVKNLPSIPQNSELNTPRGEFPSLWRSSSGELYLVKFITHFSFAFPEDEDQPSLRTGSPTAELSVSRIQIVSGTYQLPYLRTRGKSYESSSGGCGFVDISTLTSCYQTIPFELQTRINATVRLPKSVSGWMHGRISNPTISSSKTSNGQMEYQIEGDVSPTYVAGGLVPSTAMFEYLEQWNMGSAVRPGAIANTDPAGAVPYLKAFNQYIGNNALTTQNLWIVKSTGSINPIYTGGSGAGNCMRQISGFVGIVSTNAAAYDAEPPVWDNVSGVLSYKVASPHFDENGIEAVGSFSLAIPTLVAQCLYGDSALPATVPIEVGYGKVATPTTQVVAITRDENWIRFTASGFHFSNPTIKVKLGIASKFKVHTTTKMRTKSLSSLATIAKLEVGKGAKLTGSVYETSKSTCSISKNNILTRTKKGLCQIVLSSSKGKTVIRKIVLISFN